MKVSKSIIQFDDEDETPDIKPFNKKDKKVLYQKQKFKN